MSFKLRNILLAALALVLVYPINWKSNGSRHHSYDSLRPYGSQDSSVESRNDRGSSRTGRGGGSSRHEIDYSESTGETVQYNCSLCNGSSTIDRNAKRSYRIESIKADILRKLHMRSPPNITGRQLPDLSHIHRWIRKIDDDTTEGYHGPDEDWEDTDDDRATTMKVIQVSKPVPVGRIVDFSVRDNVCYFAFPMSEIRHVQQIVRLNFGIYVRQVAQNPRGPAGSTSLLVYLMRQDGDRRFLRRRQISLSSQDTGRWYHFRLAPSEIQNWLNNPDSNYGLLVESSNGRGEPLAVVTPLNADEEPFRPYIEVETTEMNSNGRYRRATDMNCDERSAEKRCCRYPLEVDFASFKWDWIIVPIRYSAYYCSGECPYLYYQQHGNAHISQIARPSGAGGPCCSPRKVSSISMLYYDQHMNIVYGRLPSMVVDRCGCS